MLILPAFDDFLEELEFPPLPSIDALSGSLITGRFGFELGKRLSSETALGSFLGDVGVGLRIVLLGCSQFDFSMATSSMSLLAQHVQILWYMLSGSSPHR